MPSALADIVFKGYRARVLSLLLLRPDQAYHVREIARLTNTIPGTLHKELTKLAEAGVLTQTSQGNQRSYQANRHCLIFDELASILRKTVGVAELLAEALAPLSDQITTAVVFGSMASGKANRESDIDLLVVGEISFSAVVNVLYPTQALLGREINPKLYSLKEWQAAKKTKAAFIRDILAKPTLKVLGDMDDSGQLTRHEPRTDNP